MNPMLQSFLYLLVSAGVMLVVFGLFHLITGGRAWKAIGTGNTAAAAAAGGFFLGVANVLRAAVSANDTLLETMLWGGAGALALMLVNVAFEGLTRRLPVAKEIEKGNLAVGLMSCMLTLSFSLLIGACIS